MPEDGKRMPEAIAETSEREGKPREANGEMPEREGKPREAITEIPEKMAAIAEIAGPKDIETGKASEKAVAPKRKREIVFRLNGASLPLPVKDDGQPYYLMDMLEYSGIDLKNPKGTVKLSVNGAPGMFQQALKAGDVIDIREE